MIVCLSVRTFIYANSITNTPLDSFLEKFEKELKRYGSQMKLERELKEYGSPMKLERELKGYESQMKLERELKGYWYRLQMTINPLSLNKDHRNY